MNPTTFQLMLLALAVAARFIFPFQAIVADITIAGLLVLVLGRRMPQLVQWHRARKTRKQAKSVMEQQWQAFLADQKALRAKYHLLEHIQPDMQVPAGYREELQQLTTRYAAVIRARKGTQLPDKR